MYPFNSHVDSGALLLSRRERQRRPWTGHQPIAGLTHKDTPPSTLTPTVNADASAHPTNGSLHFGRKPGCPDENQRVHREDLQTLHTKAEAKIQTPNFVAVR